MNYSLVYAGAPGCHDPPGPQRGPGSPSLQGLPGSATVPANPTHQAFTGLPAQSPSPDAPGQMCATGTKFNYHIELCWACLRANVYAKITLYLMTVHQ